MDKTIEKILKVVDTIKIKGPYIKITEFPSFYVVATDDKLDPMIFTKDGLITPVNFVELKKEQLVNPKIVYKKG